MTDNDGDDCDGEDDKDANNEHSLFYHDYFLQYFDFEDLTCWKSSE